MVDNYPSSPFRHHVEAKLSSDSVCGDSLADSASGLDPDLESILRKDRFSSFVDGKKIAQIIRGLQEKAPEEFDIAGQMAEAVRVSLDDYKDPEEGWRSQERSERVLAVFDTMANLATPEEMKRFLRSCTLKRLRNEWSGSLNVLPKRYNYLGYSHRSEEKPDNPEKLRLLTRYVLGQVVDEGGKKHPSRVSRLARSLTAVNLGNILSLREREKNLLMKLYFKDQSNPHLWTLCQLIGLRMRVIRMIWE